MTQLNRGHLMRDRFIAIGLYFVIAVVVIAGLARGILLMQRHDNQYTNPGYYMAKTPGKPEPLDESKKISDSNPDD